MTRQQLADRFSELFGRPCEAMARAPGRVNLIGEHTDYNEGFVLPVALDRCTWAAAAGRTDGWIRVHSAALGERHEWALDDWPRDALPGWTAYPAGVAALLRERGARLAGVDLLVESDVPIGAGLSSSAALEVSTALALAALCGEPLESSELIDLCRRAEHEFAGVPCGIMDQSAALLARAGHALLLDCRTREPRHVPLRLDGHSLLVVDSGVRRRLAEGEYAARRAQCEAAVAYFRRRNAAVRALRDVTSETVRAHASQMDPLAAARALHVAGEDERTLAAAAALERSDAAALGALLSESHASLRDHFEASCAEVDRLVDALCGVSGVRGARLTGAGFGGCLVVLVGDEALPAAEAAVCATGGEVRPLLTVCGGAGAGVV